MSGKDISARGCFAKIKGPSGDFTPHGPHLFAESENKRAVGPLRDTHGFDALS
jgi:hypothetical protein